MKRRIIATLALAALTLTGCAGDPSSASGAADQPPVTRNLPVYDPVGLYESKPVIDGTELVCMREDSHGSMTCDWELWNKQREVKK